VSEMQNPMVGPDKIRVVRRYRKAPRGLSEEERFWFFVNKTETCWLWTGHLAGRSGHKYGHFWLKGKRKHVKAHTWSFVQAYGPIEPGYEPDHLCRVAICVRPDHMEKVTKRVNILRGIGPTAINAKKTHCPRGHLYDRVNNKGSRECSTCTKKIQLARYHRTKQPRTKRGWTWNRKPIVS